MQLRSQRGSEDAIGIVISSGKYRGQSWLGARHRFASHRSARTAAHEQAYAAISEPEPPRDSVRAFDMRGVSAGRGTARDRAAVTQQQYRPIGECGRLVDIVQHADDRLAARA